MLRDYVDGAVITYEVPQGVIVREFAPCADPASAFEVVSNSELANLASIYHEASLNDDGSIQILFRVSKDARYTPGIFEGEFSGQLDSTEFEGFLDSMAEDVRTQVEDFADGVRQYVDK